jgi:hypothetical protein
MSSGQTAGFSTMSSSVAADMERYDSASARWLNARLPNKASGLN